MADDKRENAGSSTTKQDEDRGTAFEQNTGWGSYGALFL
jgi:hypothetical protein